MKQTPSGQKAKALRMMVLGMYLFWISIAEALTIFFDPQLGLWAHASLLAGLLIHSALDRSRPMGRVWLCLSLAPIIRIISLSTPLSGFPLIYWYLITGTMLFIAVFVMLRYLRLPRRELALQARWTPGQIMVGLSGLALGYVEYLILRPDPLAPRDNPWALVEALLILVVFTGLLEEIIFRGMMQGTIERVFGKKGVVYVALVFTILHLGYQSLADMVFVFGVALYFGFYVHRTRSILGVTLSHGLINVALFLIFPFVLAYPSPAPETAEPALLAPHADEATPTPFNPILPTDTPTVIQATLAVLPTAAVSSSTPTSSPNPSPTPIVVDDGDEGFIATGGRWWLEEAGYEGDFRWAGTHASYPYAEVFWRPKIETCGFYEVKVYIPENYPTSQQARYQIAHREGIDAVIVDQSSQSGWITLGEYEFAPDGDTYLQLDNATGEPDEWERIIVFDAACWTFQSPCAADSEP